MAEPGHKSLFPTFNAHTLLVYTVENFGMNTFGGHLGGLKTHNTTIQQQSQHKTLNTLLSFGNRQFSWLSMQSLGPEVRHWEDKKPHVGPWLSFHSSVLSAIPTGLGLGLDMLRQNCWGTEQWKQYMTERCDSLTWTTQLLWIKMFSFSLESPKKALSYASLLLDILRTEASFFPLECGLLEDKNELF